MTAWLWRTREAWRTRASGLPGRCPSAATSAVVHVPAKNKSTIEAMTTQPAESVGNRWRMVIRRALHWFVMALRMCFFLNSEKDSEEEEKIFSSSFQVYFTPNAPYLPPP